MRALWKEKETSQIYVYFFMFNSVPSTVFKVVVPFYNTTEIILKQRQFIQTDFIINGIYKFDLIYYILLIIYKTILTGVTFYFYYNLL